MRETSLNDQKTLVTALADDVRRAESASRTLNLRLKAYREHSHRLRPEFTKAYDRLVARLGMLDRGEIGPQLGERMPSFLLPDENGRLVSLDSLLRSGPVVVSFNRGHWCPYCKLELRSLAGIYPEIERLGAQIVSIMPDRVEFTQRSAELDALPFPVLSDIDLGYSLSLGLIYWVGAEIRRLYEDAGVELELYHGNQTYFLPMAAKFIVGPDGLVKSRQVNIEFRQRMEPEEIVAVLRKLREPQ